MRNLRDLVFSTVEHCVLPLLRERHVPPCPDCNRIDQNDHTDAPKKIVDELKRKD